MKRSLSANDAELAETQRRERQRERQREHQRRYREKNKERARLYAKDYRDWLRERHQRRQEQEVLRRGGGCECCHYADGPRWHFAWAHIVPVTSKRQRAAMKQSASDEVWHAEVKYTRYLCLFCHAVETELQRARGWQPYMVTWEGDVLALSGGGGSGGNVGGGKEQRLYERRRAEIERRGGACEQCGCVGGAGDPFFQWAHMVAVKGARRARANYALSANSTDAEWAAEVAKCRFLCLLCHADETQAQRAEGWAAPPNFSFFSQNGQTLALPDDDDDDQAETEAEEARDDDDSSTTATTEPAISGSGEASDSD